MIYHHNWILTGPFQLGTISGEPRRPPVSYIEARHQRIGHCYHTRPLLLYMTMPDAMKTLDERDAKAESLGEGDKAVSRWGVRAIGGDMLQAYAYAPGWHEPVLAKARTRSDVLAKLRTRVASLGRYLTDREEIGR